ncbi:MAG: helix-turn-helix domain-containing protein [Planctomycetaceae bacterium]|nr:helix-turn-helix domain-containing protein [Planctomycetaceae bacterium]
MRGQNEKSTDVSTVHLDRSSSVGSLLTVKDVAERLRLSPTKIYALTQCGELECFRFGRSVRVSEVQLASYLNGVRHAARRFPKTTSRHF